MIKAAIGEDGTALSIEDPMNNEDIAILKAYLTSNANTALLTEDSNTGLAPNLSKVTELTEFPDYAFSECTNLSSVQLSDNIIRIGASAFSGCTNLTTVNMPQNLISMGRVLFMRY